MHVLSLVFFLHLLSRSHSLARFSLLPSKCRLLLAGASFVTLLFFFSNHLPLKKSQIHANQFLMGIFLAIRNAPILVIGSTYTHTWSWYACVIVCMYVCWKSGFVLISYGHKRNEQSEMEVKFNEVYIHSVWLFFLFFSFGRVFFGFSFSYWMLSWWRRVLYLYAALCAHQLSI